MKSSSRPSGAANLSDFTVHFTLAAPGRSRGDPLQDLQHPLSLGFAPAFGFQLRMIRMDRFPQGLALRNAITLSGISQLGYCGFIQRERHLYHTFTIPPYLTADVDFRG